FMPDVLGRYFRVFGMSLVTAIVASAVTSLTLTPALCSRLLGARARAAQARPSPPARSLLLAAYLRSLDVALRHPAVVVAALLLTLGGSAALYLMLPKGLMPTQDCGILRVRTVAIANISFAAMESLQRAVTAEILRHPAVVGASSYIGTDNGTTLSNGNIMVSLRPIDERKETIQQVIAELRERLDELSA